MEECLSVVSFNCVLLNDVAQTIRELSVRQWRSVCAEHKNVGAILVVAPYSVIALLLIRQFMNCPYVGWRGYWDA